MKHTDQTDFEQWLHERLSQLPEPEVSPEFLAAQRRASIVGWTCPSTAGPRCAGPFRSRCLLLMIAGGLTLERRHKTQPVVSTPMSTISDDQLFSDLSAMEQRNEPKAIQPMHGLFRE